MQLQWYPGHMHKAGKELKTILPKIDLIIEILDARIPFSSENPMLATLWGTKPCIKVLNKTDLADPVKTRQWQDYIAREHNAETLALTSKQPEKVQQLTDLCRKSLSDKSQHSKTIHTLILGIPNVGKSTLINILAGRTIAKTGNEPAITKRQQRITLGNGIVLSDTPGVLWPNIENRNSGYRLAATGAIKDTAMHHDDVAYFTAAYLLEYYPRQLQNRYQLETLPENEYQFIEYIGKKRGCLGTGGQIDTDKASKLLLNELRSGTIGRITLETPAMMQQELAELIIIREQKAAKKAARLQRKQKKRS